MTRISIVTPSLNSERFIREAIESVLDQNYPDLEYLVIDGGSSDRTAEIAKSFTQDLEFIQERDRGPYDAVNKGFARTGGEIMAWLNSNDVYCPWALRTVASIFEEHPEVEWITTTTQVILGEDSVCSRVASLRGASRESFLDGRHIPWRKNSLGAIQQESTFWRRSLWERAGGRIRSEFPLAGDFDLWSQFFQHGQVHLIKPPLGCFRRHFDQKSLGRAAYQEEADRSLSEMRRACSWKSDRWKSTAVALRLEQIPLVRRYVFRYLGHEMLTLDRRVSDGRETWLKVPLKYL